MPSMRVSRQVPRTFVPAEALARAARLRGVAARLRELAGSTGTDQARLDSSWEGRSHNRYALEHGSTPSELSSLVQQLEDQAREAETTTVTVYETVWEEVWVPGGAD